MQTVRSRGFSSLRFNCSRTFFFAIFEAGPVSSTCPFPNIIWQNKSCGAHANLWCRKKEVLVHIQLSCGAGGDITAACVSGCGRRVEGVCHVSFVCGAFALYIPAPVCLACLSCSSLAFFISLSVYGSSPPPHIFIFFAWHLILSCCLSFSLPQSSRLFFGSLLVCLWCPHGRLNDWSHKAVPPTHTYAELSCPKLRCWFSRSAHLKEKAECDSHEKVGGAGPGGWLNRLSVASQKCSLAHGRCNDK